MRWIIGTVAFFAPIILVLAASAQTPMSGAVLDMMDQVATITMH
ncbi:MAG TPA: hypothetical protein PLH23_09835 [Hyphomonadaceae bacterium]|jgi:hypothetical protein|nr:hypothetical protein [Hyphomonadaceae bacterium]HPI48557.1 hypothetical protein [Hyphomonadaceae bacterium]